MNDDDGSPTHFAIKLRDDGGRGGEKRPCVWRKRPDTILAWPEEPQGRTCNCRSGYDKVLARAAEDIYEGARLREHERRAGFVASAHDYSKDLNAIDMAFGRLRKTINDKKERIPLILSEHPDIQKAVASELSDLELEYNQFSLRDRFLMAHQRAQTEGRLYEQPEWCIDHLSGGTKGEIYQLIRLLVWEPLGSNRYRKLAETPEPNEAEVADWSRLFGYDETGMHPEIDNLLATHLKRCFITSKMSNEKFGYLHPLPKLKPGDTMDAKIFTHLSGGAQDRFIPGRLMPLFVFSLRAAFQHAWLTSFFKAAIALDAGREMEFTPVSETVMLKEKMSEDCYAISLSFPNPFSVERIPVSVHGTGGPLPWGDWERQIDHYRGLTQPWDARAEELEKRLIITIKA